MFPKPIEKASPVAQHLYKVALPIALLVWLLPLIAVALTSMRSQGDIVAGNYWGWPTSFNMLENYSAIFKQTPIGNYILNSFRVTIPTVIGAVALSCMAGYALAIYRFKGNLAIFFL
ncbi:MAG: carbohydrate ABC transporter permease, partial [Gammaproteobacteria bacterium]|nr:carbohydrate ABC transporter permease [Gammaproteobacteria bacterium]